MASHRRPFAGVAAALLLAAVLTACAPEVTPAGQAASPSASASPAVTDSASASPTPTGTPAAAIPTDCKAILSANVLAQLEGIPLNQPAFGPSGVLPDGSLLCIWGDPAADTTGLTTTILLMSRGPALDLLNGYAASDGYTCYTPDGGTRCEGSWQNATYPVTDGRTLFWRDGILIDTMYSNLSPSGYTSSIVDHIWPE